MKIVLRNLATGLYLARGGRWSPKPEEAREFLDGSRARDYSIYSHLADTTVMALPGDIAIKTQTISLAAMTAPNDARESTAKRQALPLITMKMKQPEMKSNGGEHLTVPQRAPRVVAAGNNLRKTSKSKARAQTGLSQAITQIKAKIDAGWGNALFIRGNGSGLNWEKGAPLMCVDGSSWVWQSPASDKVTFKLLLNDEIWSEGQDLVAEPGGIIELQPVFLSRRNDTF